MGAIIFILILLIVFVGGGWLIGSSIGSFFDKKLGNNQNRDIYIDYSKHYHEHKNISIIDDDTKKKIFEFKESKKNN